MRASEIIHHRRTIPGTCIAIALGAVCAWLAHLMPFLVIVFLATGLFLFLGDIITKNRGR